MGLVLLLAGVAVIVAVNWVAERTGLPSAALLALGGIAYAFLPGPNIALRPEPALYCILPPLLYYAALESSLVEIRRNMRAVVSLSVALVLLTACSVGFAFALLDAGATFAVGTALGAAVARRVGLPANMITLIEGEGLLNDATALTTLSVAIAAASGGGLSAPAAAGKFLLAAAGGFAVGVAIAAFRRLISRWTSDILTANAVSLATPFVAYLAAEEVSASGVLAVVVCGLIVGHDLPRAESGASRLHTRAVWRLVNFLLEGFVFLIIGQQLPHIMKGLDDYSTSTIVGGEYHHRGGAVDAAAVVIGQPDFAAAVAHPSRGCPGPDESWASDSTELSLNRNAQRLNAPEVFVLSWAGTRGVVSLAAIFTVPLVTESDAPFPCRDLLLFCTLVVVLVTLIGQGLTFAPLARALGIGAKPADASRLRKLASMAALRAAIDRLDALKAQSPSTIERQANDTVSAQLSAQLKSRQRQLDALEIAETDDTPALPNDEALLIIRRAAIDAQREELVRWRDAGMLPDQGLRTLGRGLDLEEGMLT